MGEKARDPSPRHQHRQGMHYPPLMYRRSHCPCMAIPQKSFCLLHLHFHLPMTGEVGSLFLLAWVKNQETSALAIIATAKQRIIFHSRTGKATIHAWQSPKKFEQKGKKFIDGQPTSLLSLSKPCFSLLQNVFLRGIDEQQFRRGQHCMEPLPSPKKRLAHGKLSFSLQFGRAATLFHSFLNRA